MVVVYKGVIDSKGVIEKIVGGAQQDGIKWVGKRP